MLYNFSFEICNLCQIFETKRNQYLAVSTFCLYSIYLRLKSVSL